MQSNRKNHLGDALCFDKATDLSDTINGVDDGGDKVVLSSKSPTILVSSNSSLYVFLRDDLNYIDLNVGIGYFSQKEEVIVID